MDVDPSPTGLSEYRSWSRNMGFRNIKIYKTLYQHGFKKVIWKGFVFCSGNSASYMLLWYFELNKKITIEDAGVGKGSDAPPNIYEYVVNSLKIWYSHSRSVHIDNSFYIENNVPKFFFICTPQWYFTAFTINLFKLFTDPDKWINNMLFHCMLNKATRRNTSPLNQSSIVKRSCFMTP